MDFSAYDPSSGHSRRWQHRHSRRERMPKWARVIISTLALLLAATFVWAGVQRLVHRGQRTPSNVPVSAAPQYSSSPTASSAPTNETPPAPSAGNIASALPGVPLWQIDVGTALDTAKRESTAGNITAAEVGMDRAATLVSLAEFHLQTAPPNFFSDSIVGLDRAVAPNPENSRLIEHATLARIELAQLRSSLEPAPPEGHGRVGMVSPRAIPANFTLDQKSAGGATLDATAMPSTLEIILPPSSRQFSDNVTVQNLVFAGASQTLDGIHWNNMTFVGTRLRYEGGGLDLKNVHFVRCTFGFTTDDRGGRIATAIALGQSSISFE